MPRLSASELASRNLGLGSTEVVEALGLSPYEGHGPMRLWLEKTSNATESDADNREELEWGHIQEPVILKWYERKMGVVAKTGGQARHPTIPWLWASLDGVIVGGDRGVEIKNVGANMGKHWDTYAEDGIPRYVRAQVTVAMACTGLRLWDVVAAIGGRPPRIWTVEYDQELANVLIGGAASFWEMVQTRTAPRLDHTPASKEYLRQKYPGMEDRVVVDADADIDVLGRARAGHHAAKKDAEKRIKRLDAEILSAIGDNYGISGNGWKMTVGTRGNRRQRFTSYGTEGDQDGEE